MDASFDARTGFMVLGILAAASAAGGYTTLRASLHRGNLLWLASGLCFGASGLLLAMRPVIPAFLSFEVAHASMVGGLVGQALALRQEGRPRLRQGARVVWLCLVLPLVSAAVFAGVRRLEVVWGFTYFGVSACMGALSVVLASVRLWRGGHQPGAAIIALTFSILAAAIAVRVMVVLNGVHAEPVFAPGLSQLVMLAAGFLTLILGQVGYLGLQFERIAKGRVATARQAAVLAERARQTQLREATLRDLVEERNQLIQHLARHQGASDLARFAMDLPHQLSQPLCASKLNLEEVLARMGSASASPRADPQVLQALHAVDASNDRMLQLLQQLRILLATHDASDHRDVELGALITQTVPILQGSFRDQAVALEVVPAHVPVTVHASPTQIQQLLLILCVNALTLLQAETRAPGAASWVRLRLVVQGDEAHLSVENSGSGRPSGERAPERIDVGMAIATRIAQAHDGVLVALPGACSGALNFRLSLPLNPPQR